MSFVRHVIHVVPGATIHLIRLWLIDVKLKRSSGHFEERSAYHLRTSAKSGLQLYKRLHYMGRNYGGMIQRIIVELLIFKNWSIDNPDRSQDC
jgi:hypothetical protein